MKIWRNSYFTTLKVVLQLLLSIPMRKLTLTNWLILLPYMGLLHMAYLLQTADEFYSATYFLDTVLLHDQTACSVFAHGFETATKMSFAAPGRPSLIQLHNFPNSLTTSLYSPRKKGKTITLPTSISPRKRKPQM
jgi:hypothetical protein